MKYTQLQVKLSEIEGHFTVLLVHEKKQKELLIDENNTIKSSLDEMKIKLEEVDEKYTSELMLLNTNKLHEDEEVTKYCIL